MHQLGAGQHLARSGQATEARGEVEGRAAKTALNGHGLAGIQADPHCQRQRGIGARRRGELRLQRHGGTERLACRGEDRERLIAAQLDNSPTVRLNARARQVGEQAGQASRRLVAVRQREGGVAAYVGDQEGVDGRRRRGGGGGEERDDGGTCRRRVRVRCRGCRGCRGEAAARAGEPRARVVREVQGVGQERDGLFARRLAGAALQVVDATHREARALGQLGLGEAGGQTMVPQQITERE